MTQQNQRELAIRRAQYIKILKIKVTGSEKTSDHDQLILIETYNTQKCCSVQLVMRKLSELDSLIEHINRMYGGHVIPTFSFDLFYQNKLEMEELIPAIEEYLHDLKYNKYCRQDAKFYCFLIEQHTYFPKQMGFQRIISNATDASRKYLNSIFTRKVMPKQRNTDILLYSQKMLKQKIEQYQQVKQISLLKAQETIYFQEITQIFAQMSAWPSLAIQPQEHDIDYIWRTIKSSQKLIEQAKKAFERWETLVDNVRELQNNVYKGLHQYYKQFEQKNQQLREWSETLSCEFNDLGEYLEDKMQALSGEVYKITSKFVDMTVFAGKGIVEEILSPAKPFRNLQKSNKSQNTQIQVKQVPSLKSIGSFQLIEDINISQTKPPILQKHISNVSLDSLQTIQRIISYSLVNTPETKPQHLQAPSTKQQFISCDD